MFFFFHRRSKEFRKNQINTSERNKRNKKTQRQNKKTNKQIRTMQAKMEMKKECKIEV